MMPGFDANAVWHNIRTLPELSLFMAVPTIYCTPMGQTHTIMFESQDSDTYLNALLAKLIATYETMDATTQQQCSAACQRLRLMVSGSSALPVSVMARWKEISSHTLLERYGMTEIGMALSNPLHGERIPVCRQPSLRIE